MMTSKTQTTQTTPPLPLEMYDYIIVAFSGGKDSLACLLHLLEQGVPRSKILLFHHEIDGREGSTLMDWPCTPAYCKAVADAFGLQIFFSWKVGGFEREMLRENARTAPTKYEALDGEIKQVGGNGGKLSTRRRFPQVCADLSKRWCSAYLKIDVMAAAIRNQMEFRHRKTLVVTGERAEESAARAKYACYEVHRSDARDGRLGRHVDHWRPIHAWNEGKVWEIIARWRVNPHPCYRLGFGRCSCMKCIFFFFNQLASVNVIDPHGIRVISNYEREFGCTIHRTLTVEERIQHGMPYPNMREADIKSAMSRVWSEPIIMGEDEWKLPAGAFGESTGPT